MQVTVAGETRNINVTSVVLGRDPDDLDSTKLYMFFCSRCGITVTQHMGAVLVLMPGRVPLPLPVIVKCPRKGCGKLYAFHSIV